MSETYGNPVFSQDSFGRRGAIAPQRNHRNSQYIYLDSREVGLTTAGVNSFAEATFGLPDSNHLINVHSVRIEWIRIPATSNETTAEPVFVEIGTDKLNLFKNDFQTVGPRERDTAASVGNTYAEKAFAVIPLINADANLNTVTVAPYYSHPHMIARFQIPKSKLTTLYIAIRKRDGTLIQYTAADNPYIAAVLEVVSQN